MNFLPLPINRICETIDMLTEKLSETGKKSDSIDDEVKEWCFVFFRGQIIFKEQLQQETAQSDLKQI